jgi:hypothetical protein
MIIKIIKEIAILILILTFVLFVISCVLFFRPQFQPRPGPKSPWLKDFLYQPACQPPCWENIIPGETPITKFPDLPGVWIKGRSKTNYYQGIGWIFINSNDSGSLRTYKEQEIIEEIDFDLRESNSLTLGDLVDVYGPPTYVIKYIEGGQFASLSFVYEPLGLEGRRSVECSRFILWIGFRPWLNINKKFLIDDIYLRSVDDVKLMASDWSMAKVEWKGYGNYNCDTTEEERMK